MGVVVASGMVGGKVLAMGAKLPEQAGEQIFGLSTEEIRRLLEIALSKGGDFSELFFEYSVNNSVTMSADIIKSSSESIDLGVGVRVLNGSQTGFGYTNELTFESIKQTALTAAAIANGASKIKIANLNKVQPKVQVYDMKNLLADKDLETKIELIKEGYEAAKKYDPRIKKVTASLTDNVSYVTIANSEGLLISDKRPQARLVVVSTAEDGKVRNTGHGNAGGTIGLDFYKNKFTPTEIGKKSAREAIELLSAKDAPAGEYPVVLGKNQSGVMIHEAVGHPLEADGIWKKTSVMAGRLGEMVASPLVTIYDDSSIPEYRGSSNFDDEGVVAQSAMLIEKGKLVGFLNDKLAAKMLKMPENGHGRRENYSFPPIPRMNNTVLAKGDSTPEEIIRSVKKGFYAETYQGGMVENTGKFTFSVNLGYMIEDGQITRPIKNATLIGSNVAILKDIDMVANDTGFFLGTCGKDGQSQPVTAGTPTLRISKMTVGGTA